MALQKSFVAKVKIMSKKSRHDYSLRRRGDNGRVETIVIGLDVMAVTEEGKGLKASFDRFGDDLSQLIVSYLTIEDKFRFQCLNRQWLRLVFEEEYVLRLSPNG